MNRSLRILVLFAVGGAFVLAQRPPRGTTYGGGEFRGGTRGMRSSDGLERPRDLPSGSTGTPVWTNPKSFEADVFTFARIKYSSGYGGGWRRGYGGGWMTDTPDSDLNLSYRLQQMTSLKVDPDGRFIDLTDPNLSSFPWIYIVEPGALQFSDLEAQALRKYLLNGGFLWFDDFWGDGAWFNVEREMRKVFPERSFVETSLDHPIYHCVFEIKAKGQVPNVRTGEYSQQTGITWEDHHDGDTQTVHHRAITDDKGRLMVLATHNTDNGDGWEREGEYEYYFKNFSEKIAYPLGINVIFYVMTH
ncbi:MAG TPA: DUF4159 domain-containing protein [Opitutaceae bacterium]|nr:DUF4159 domain-containing protein [Opitutaceae bacterium]